MTKVKKRDPADPRSYRRNPRQGGGCYVRLTAEQLSDLELIVAVHFSGEKKEWATFVEILRRAGLTPTPKGIRPLAEDSA